MSTLNFSNIQYSSIRSALKAIRELGVEMSVKLNAKHDILADALSELEQHLDSTFELVNKDGYTLTIGQMRSVAQHTEEYNSQFEVKPHVDWTVQSNDPIDQLQQSIADGIAVATEINLFKDSERVECTNAHLHNSPVYFVDKYEYQPINLETLLVIADLYVVATKEQSEAAYLSMTSFKGFNPTHAEHHVTRHVAKRASKAFKAIKYLYALSA